MILRERLDPRRFFRGEKAVDGPVTLDYRRVFILPNRRGLGLALLLLIQTLAATNYNNNLAFILSFLLVGIALMGIFYNYRNLADVVLRCGRAEPVFAGENAVFELHLDNPTRTPRLSLEVGLKRGAIHTVHLSAAESQTVRLSRVAERRGWLNLPTVTLSTRFPLGLFTAWSPVNLNYRTLVYPRPAPDPQPFPEHPGHPGQQQAADDFHGFQSYQPGDPLRHIHWKGVAKGQGVHVKEYRGEEFGELWFDWSRTPGQETEARLSRLCRWVIDAERTGARYALRLPGVAIKAATGPNHMRRCLEALALYAGGS